MNRPITTLYMLMSLDGKISTGATDELDVDQDFPQIIGLREGIHQFVLITTNEHHPAFNIQAENLHIIFQEKLCLAAALMILKEKFGCERLTIQSGGTVNGLFLREKLFDFVDIVVAPVLIGGRDTATLIDGQSLQAKDELDKLGVLRLIEAVLLQDSYLRLRYQVIG